MVKSVVKHIFDRYFSFSEPPEIRTVEGLSAVGTDKRQNAVYASKPPALPAAPHPDLFDFHNMRIFSQYIKSACIKL